MAELKRKRSTFKSKLTLFSKFVTQIQDKADITDLQIIQLTERLNKIEMLINEFDEVQTRIESTVKEEDIEKELGERAKFKNDYYEQISLSKKIINDYNKKADSDHESLSSLHDVQILNEGSIHSSSCNIKLPTIQLPKFDGQYSGWLEFRDTYMSLIHENETINHIKKFHYLRASLEGASNKVLRIYGQKLWNSVEHTT